MKIIQFVAGFIAGVFDGLGMISTRDLILGSVKRTGATSNGFDLTADLFMSMALNRIARRYRHMPLPGAEAMREVQLRAVLEEFRDFASERFLADRTLSIDAIRKEFLDVLKPGARAAGGFDDAKIVSNAIKDMPPAEMLHAKAYSVWRADCDALRRPIARSPHERRVLRSA